MKQLQKIILILQQFYQKNLAPPYAYHWKSFYLFFAFSFLMQYTLGEIPKLCAIFLTKASLIIALSWMLVENNPKIAPFGMSLVFCFLFFRHSPEFLQITLIFAPIISSIFYTTSVLLRIDLIPSLPEKKEDRKPIFTALILAFAVSFVIQEHLILKQIMISYPTLSQELINRNQELIFLKPETPNLSRGLEILQKLNQLVAEQINEKPWKTVEKLNLIEQKKIISEQLKKQLSPLPEDEFWEINLHLEKTKLPYILGIQVQWIDSSWKIAKPEFVTQCKITPQKNIPNSVKTLKTQVECLEL